MQTIGIKAVTLIGMSLMLGIKSCSHNAAVAPDYQIQNGDPANVNMAPVPGSQRMANQPQRVLDRRDQSQPYQASEQYPDQRDPDNFDPAQDAYEEANLPPPPLPQYAQPPATRPNTIWTPGFWGHAPTGYYWVPGAWVAPPRTGQLWTPAYWAADGPRYQLHPGYWGPHVGFYGGVPYGAGYNGTGYRGGYWNGDRFNLNQAVNQFDPNLIRDVYNQPEPMSYPFGRASYNGGRGGIAILPIAAELIALHERHERPLQFQIDLERQAAQNRAQFFGYNHGRPEIYAANETYIANRREPRDEIIERPYIVERGGPPGHAYGHYKDHGEGHEGKDHDHEGDGDHGDKHGHGEGHGHGGHDRD